ncbi:MAG: antibiotic biosynthesis monooxygenase [Anaerolineales bacterium]|nr:antibiotic biosynthesis monooxygenase [Anaerolineales bacterium]
MIVIIGKVTIQPDKQAWFIEEINKAVEATLQEDGVSRYELVQAVGEPNTFMMLEEYADEAALAHHMGTEHLKALGAALGNVLAGPPEIKRYNVTSTELLQM